MDERTLRQVLRWMSAVLVLLVYGIYISSASVETVDGSDGMAYWVIGAAGVIPIVVLVGAHALWLYPLCLPIVAWLYEVTAWEKPTNLLADYSDWTINSPVGGAVLWAFIGMPVVVMVLGWRWALLPSTRPEPRSFRWPSKNPHDYR